MPNPREPINILLAKGRKHLTQEEIQRRMATEPTRLLSISYAVFCLKKKKYEDLCLR